MGRRGSYEVVLQLSRLACMYMVVLSLFVCLLAFAWDNFFIFFNFAFFIFGALLSVMEWD